jgi:hypothetical protein
MRVYAVVSEQMSDEATSSMRALTPSRRASRRILEGVGFVAFVYYGATRRVTEQQALFLADGLEGRYAASAVALRLAKRIREEAAARRGRDIEL